MQFYVSDIEFDFDDDEANTVCNSDLDTFSLLQTHQEKK